MTLKTVWVFPGQGSQAVGMGMDLLAVGQDKFAKAEEILGWSIADKCQGDIAELSQTQYTQPCLYTISAILVDILKSKGKLPDLVTGHSLGEYTALYAAEVFDFATGLELVKQRSLLMSQVTNGAMTALIGFDRQQLEAAIANTPDLVLANDNSAEQVVISGTPEAIKSIGEQVKIKRAIPLAVSGAFHSHFMADVASKFAQEFLAKVLFQDAKVPVLSNVEPADPTQSATVLKDRLMQQITLPVRWREISLYLEANSYQQAVEIGAGKVLTGLIKRTASNVKLANINTLAQAEEF